MLVALEEMRGEHVFSIELLDVDACAMWGALYGERVPVLTLADEEICHYYLDVAKVREVLGRFR